jgi:exopolysaccharide biosynthesis protein
LDVLKGRHEVKAFVSNDKIEGLAPLSEVVKAKEALAGVNGGFYNYEGRPLGAVMVDGQMVSEPLYNRATLGITRTGEVLIDNIKWRGLLNTENNNNIVIDAVNRKPNSENEIIMYNKYFGKKTPQFQQETLELTIENEVVTKVERGSLIQNSIPEDGFVVKIFTGLNDYTAFQEGKDVQYTNVFNPAWHKEDVINIMGGGPKLVTDGEVAVTGDLENFSQDITAGRAPRTVVGITEDKHLLFVTVDGRQPELSIGMTLQEMAQYLTELDVTEAMNLDGGDSSQLVIRGYTFNNPSGYRDIATGILIKKQQ